jgi:integrase/recombinase XerC/integrase/recombinase XerD
MANKNIDLSVWSILVQTDLKRVLGGFLIDRQVSGVRPATLDYYRVEIGIFLKWANVAGARELRDLAPDILRAYFLNLRERRSVKGVYQNFAAVRTWLLWSWEEYELPAPCPIRRVKVETPDDKPKPGVTMDQAGRLLKACVGRCEKRDKALLLTLIDTGLRRRECTALTVGQLSGDTLSLAADGTKTGRARSAYLSRSTLKALATYLSSRSELDSSSPLFATDEGTPLTVSGLRQIVRRLCKRAGITEQGLHGFRRLFALETWRASHDLEAVSKLLGHTNTATTQRYLDIGEDDLREVHQRSSPVERLKKRK